MSTKIELKIQTQIDLELFEHGTTFRLVRLISKVRLKTDVGWTRALEGIIDTGSVISVLPYYAWKDTDLRLLSFKKTILRGIAPQKDAVIKAKMAEIVCSFHDKNNISQPLKIKAYLLADNSVPLIIGFEDVLTNVKLVSDYKSDYAYLEFDP